MDGVSTDGAHAITLIAFVGSVFSPWYFAARQRGPADPGAYCALNVLVRSRGANRFALTERRPRDIQRDASNFTIGPSHMHWDGTTLRFEVNEHGAPLPHPIRGTVTVTPDALTGARFPLDPEGAHHWSPLSPRCHISVALDAPALRWDGAGYLDSNDGTRALETDFTLWDWSCARLSRNAAFIHYERAFHSGGTACLNLHIGADGTVTETDPPPRTALPRTAWRLPRNTRADAIHSVKTLDDTPFYARSVLHARILGEDAVSMHETLSLDRFRTPWMQAMLHFRMRRAGVVF